MLRFSRPTLPGALACVLLVGGLLSTGCDAVDSATEAPTSNAECALGMSDEDAYAELDALEADVNALEAAGSLNRGQANALRNKLDHVRTKIERGQYCPALAQLNAFREQVGSFVADGVLTEAEAEPLIDGVDAVIDGPPPPPPPSPTLVPQTITTGRDHSCGLTSAGTAYCWGSNEYGQLGDGTAIDRLTPTPVSGGLAFTAINANGWTTCGIDESGAAYCWGRNQLGQFGDGTTADQPTPTPVAGGIHFVSISTGFASACGVDTEGTGYCWGSNTIGELGDGTREDRLVPTPVAGDITFATIDIGGSVTCGLDTYSTAYCWGRNDIGAVGDGTTTHRSVPTLVSGGLTFRDIGVSDLSQPFVCGLENSGTVYCWGFNSPTTGFLGNGGTAPRLVPTPVAGGLTFDDLAVGTYHSCAVDTADDVYCWGRNQVGRFGNGGTEWFELAPTLSISGFSFAEMDAESLHTCAVTEEGGAYCWGGNDSGQLGDGTTEDRLVPVPVSAPFAP